MTDLARKYRPQRFEEVVGQDHVVDWLRSEISTGSFRSVLLSGPFGTGKTTLGLIYAKAIFCQAPRGGEACHACEACRAFGEDGRSFVDLLRFECGETSTVESVNELLKVARTVPFEGDRRVIIMDEAHNLSRRAFEALLKIFERPPKWTTFIVLTSKITAILPALLSRLTHFGLSLLDLSTATDYLADVCTKEGMEFERSGLALLHASVGGHARGLLRALEKTITYGDVTEANARLALNLDFLERITTYCEALLSGNFERQVECIDNWPDTASHKLEYLHRFLVSAYRVGVRRLRQSDPLFQSMPDPVIHALVDGMRERAQRLGLDEVLFWEDAISSIAKSERVSDYSLPIELSRFNRLINGIPNGPAANKATSSVKLSPRIRVLRSTSVAASSDRYGKWNDIRPIWVAASFMTQEYGVLFNLRVTVRVPGVTEPHSKNGAKVVAELTHEMGERLRDWSGGSAPVLHWIYRHQPEPEGSFVSRIALSVPHGQLDAVRHWARTKFFARRLRTYPELDFSLAYCDAGHIDFRNRFHWRTVRALSRDLDPALLERAENGERRSLVDLLKIPPYWRAPSGALPAMRSRATSDTLGPKVQKASNERLPTISALRDRAWQFLDSGWELSEFKDRQSEFDRLQDHIRRIHALFPGDDTLSRTRREEALAEAEGRALVDPELRLRSWDGWWQTGSVKPRK